MKYVKTVKAAFVSGLKYREAIGYNSYHLMLLGKKSPKVSILGGHCSSKSSLCLAHVSACIFLPESAFLYLKFYWFLFSFLINESQDCSNIISAGIKSTGISINLRPSICSKIPPAFLTQLLITSRYGTYTVSRFSPLYYKVEPPTVSANFEPFLDYLFFLVITDTLPCQPSLHFSNKFLVLES